MIYYLPLEHLDKRYTKDKIIDKPIIKQSIEIEEDKSDGLKEEQSFTEKVKSRRMQRTPSVKVTSKPIRKSFLCVLK